MKRIVLCSALIMVVGLSSPVESGHLFVEPDAAALALELVSEPANYDRPASDEFTVLQGVGECSRTEFRGIVAAFGWEVTRAQIEAFRIDVSLFRDGFKAGRYLTSGELAVAERQLVFEDAQPGMYYYWRLLTKTPEVWIVSGHGRLETPVCPVDEVHE